MHARLDDFVRTRFVLLDERPGEEIVVGLVGRLGRLRGGVAGVDAETFASFDQPGYAKAAMNFRVEARVHLLRWSRPVRNIGTGSGATSAWSATQHAAALPGP